MDYLEDESKSTGDYAKQCHASVDSERASTRRSRTSATRAGGGSWRRSRDGRSAAGGSCGGNSTDTTSLRAVVLDLQVYHSMRVYSIEGIARLLTVCSLVPMAMAACTKAALVLPLDGALMELLMRKSHET